MAWFVSPSTFFVGGSVAMKTKKNDRRLKRLAVEPCEFIDIVQGWRSHQRLARIVSEAMPDDADILDVYYDHYCRSFFLVLHSEAFPVVPEGELVPRFVELEKFEAISLDEAKEERAQARTSKNFLIVQGHEEG